MSDSSRIRKYFKVEENSNSMNNTNNFMNSNSMNNTNNFMNSNNMYTTNNFIINSNTNNNNNNKAELNLSSIGIMGIKTSFLDKYKFKDEDHLLFFNDNIEGTCKRR